MRFVNSLNIIVSRPNIRSSPNILSLTMKVLPSSTQAFLGDSCSPSYFNHRNKFGPRQFFSATSSIQKQAEVSKKIDSLPLFYFPSKNHFYE